MRTPIRVAIQFCWIYIIFAIIKGATVWQRKRCLSMAGYLIQCLMISAKSCGDPGSPTNGNRVGWLFQYNQTVRFKCLEGYILEGPKARTCQANQTWSGIQPICKRKPDSHGIIKFILSSYFAWCILTNFSQVFFFPKRVIVSTSCSFNVYFFSLLRAPFFATQDVKFMILNPSLWEKREKESRRFQFLYTLD